MSFLPLEDPTEYWGLVDRTGQIVQSEEFQDGVKDIVPVYGAVNRFSKGQVGAGLVDLTFDALFFLKPLRYAGEAGYLLWKGYRPVSRYEFSAVEAASLTMRPATNRAAEEAARLTEAARVEREALHEQIERDLETVEDEARAALARIGAEQAEHAIAEQLERNIAAAERNAASDLAQMQRAARRTARDFTYDVAKGTASRAIADVPFAFKDGYDATQDQPVDPNGPTAQKEPVQILRAEDDEVVTTPMETVQRVTRTQQVTLAAALLLAAAYIEFRRR